MDETTRANHLTVDGVFVAIRVRFREAFRVRRGQFAVATADSDVTDATPAAYTFTEIAAERVACDPLIASRGKTAKFTERLADAHHCFAFLDQDGATAAYFWLTVADRETTVLPWELGTSLAVPKGTAVIWDCYTAAAHRQRGLYTSGLRLLRTVCAERGVRRVAICAAFDNAASLSGIASARFRPRCTFTVVRAGGHAWVWTSDGYRSFRRLTAPHAVLASL